MRAVVALLVLGLVAAGCNRNSPERKGTRPERVTNVRVEIVQPRPAEDRLILPARVEPWTEVRVAAEVDGRVVDAPVEEGDVVGEGQVLFRLDGSLLEAQLAQAEAALEAAKAEREKIERGARPEELAIAEAKMRAAKAAAEQARALLAQASASEDNAQRELARLEKLFQNKVVSEDQLDRARTAAIVARRKREGAEELLRAAQQQLRAAQQEYQMLREGARREDRAVAAARVAQAQAALLSAKTRLEKTVVRAPITGLLQRRYVDPGEYVRAGQPLADIVDIRRVKVEVSVPERDVVHLNLGGEMEVFFDALGRRCRGKVIFCAPAADPKTLTFRTKLALDNPGGVIRPGMVCRVTLVRNRLERAMLVPIFAVMKRERGYVVFVEEGGRARERPVRLGFFVGNRVVVEEGLRFGDRLIVAGQRDLADGARVRVIEVVASPTTTLPASAEGSRL